MALARLMRGRDQIRSEARDWKFIHTDAILKKVQGRFITLRPTACRPSKVHGIPSFSTGSKDLRLSVKLVRLSCSPPLVEIKVCRERSRIEESSTCRKILRSRARQLCLPCSSLLVETKICRERSRLERGSVGRKGLKAECHTHMPVS